MTPARRPGPGLPAPRRTARSAAALVVALALGVVAGCGVVQGSPTPSSSDSPTSVRVAGGAWAVPTLAYPAGLDASHPWSEVLWAGAGPVVRDGDLVLLDVYAEDARTRKVVSDTYASSPRAVRLERTVLGDALYDLVVGRASGSRVLSVQESDGVPLVTVVDVLAAHAVGQRVAQGKNDPVVTVGPGGAPSVAVPKGAKPPTELTVLPLVRGTGPQVVAGQDVTVQFTGVTWSDGKVFDSTWSTGKAPVTVRVGVGQVIEGWDEGLFELPVGSRVLLVVPPEFGYAGTDSTLADQTLVYVVDILDAHTPGSAPKPGSTAPRPTPAPTPRPSS